MSLTIEDLKPKNYFIKVKGVELECTPLKLSHTMVIASVGDIFNNIKTASMEDIKKAESEMDTVISEVIPSLKGVQLDGATVLEIITQLMDHTVPTDVQYLEKNGVKLNADPKAEKVG